MLRQSPLALLAALALVLALAPTTADAQDDTWHFTLEPYAFLTGLSGSITADHVTYPINSSFSDLVENLRVGAFVSFTGHKDRWGFITDLEYMSLKGEGTGRIPLELTLDTFIGEVDATYAPADQSSLRFLAGLRVFDVTQTLLVGEDPAFEASTTVIDPVAGAVASWDLGDRWRFGMRADIGGFGVSSEITYQLMLEFQWRISPSTGLPFGYRILGYQIQQDDVWLNTRLGGLFVGLDFRF